MTSNEMIITKYQSEEENKNVAEHINNLSDQQKLEGNPMNSNNLEIVLQAGESINLADSEEDASGLALTSKNSNGDLASDPSSLSVADGVTTDKHVGDEVKPVSYYKNRIVLDKCNLIINYLPQSFTENDVMRHFSPFGLINQCKVVRDFRTGKSKGYGFVKYADEKSAVNAIKELNGFPIENKRLKVTVARKRCKKIRNSNLYVTHLPKSLDREGLEELFKPFGSIVECTLLKDKQGRNRGVGFVRFDTHDNALQALQALDKTRPNGWQKELRVSISLKRLQSPRNNRCPKGYVNFWRGFYPLSPNSQMSPPWCSNYRNPHSQVFSDLSSPCAFGAFRYPEYAQPFSYQHHAAYSYTPHHPGPGWNQSQHMSMCNNCDCRKRLECGYGLKVRSPRRYFTVLVTNLADNVDENYLSDMFSEQRLETCKVVRCKGSRPRAYINFQTHKDALHACKFDGRVVNGRAMKIYLIN